MELNIASQKIQSKIKEADNILLVCHQQPDADAVGSIVSLSEWIFSLGKKQTKFCKDPSPESLAWLTNFENLETKAGNILHNDYDLMIVVDSGDLQYAAMDDIVKRFTKKPFIINIDHHATNKFYGDLNVVDINAASTTEIIYRIFKTLKINISPRVASALLSGIIGDTYSFTNPNTGQQSLEAASGLLLSGASLPKVNDSVLKNKSVDMLRLWGRALTRLRYNPRLDMAVTVVTHEDMADFNHDYEAVEGISNFLNNLDGVKAALILIQQGEMVKGSFRTNNDLIDVSKLAKMLGGGGHKKAAGFKVKGQIKEDENGFYQIV